MNPSRLRIPSHVRWHNFQSEVVVLDLERGQYYGLNEAAGTIFERVARGQEVSEIVLGMFQEFDADREELERDVIRAIDDLVGRGLVERVVPGPGGTRA